MSSDDGDVERPVGEKIGNPMVSGAGCHRGIAPEGGGDHRLPADAAGRAQGRHDDQRRIARPPFERDDMAPALASHRKRRDRRREQLGAVLTKPKRVGDQRLLDPATLPVRARPGGDRAPRRVIDGPAIVGIDEAEVPELGALIGVGHAGQRQAQRGLDEAIERAGRYDPVREGGDGRLGDQRLGGLDRSRLIRLVGRGP